MLAPLCLPFVIIRMRRMLMASVIVSSTFVYVSFTINPKIKREIYVNYLITSNQIFARSTLKIVALNLHATPNPQNSILI